ncbi:MAG: hypothetical protein AB7H90_01450 [Alphaproteobacteria bacterium]
MRRHVADLERQNEALAAERDTITKERDAAKERLQQVEAGQKELADRAERHKREIADAYRETDRLEKDKAALSAANARDQAEIRKLQQEKTDLLAQLRAMESEAATWKQKHGDLSERSQEKIAAAEKNAAAWATKLEDLSGEVEKGTGIARCSGYVTEDKRHHDTLEAAERHMLAIAAEQIAEAQRHGIDPDPETLSRLDKKLQRLNKRIERREKRKGKKNA